MKLLRFTTNLLAFTPFAFPAALLSYAIRATAHLGHRPFYNQPDPKDLRFHIHHEIVGWSFNISFYGIILYIIMAIISACLRSRLNQDCLVMFVTGISIAMVMFIGPFFEWYAD